jgi:hypothetical protein
MYDVNRTLRKRELRGPAPPPLPIVCCKEVLVLSILSIHFLSFTWFSGTCRMPFHPICARESKHQIEIWGKSGQPNVRLPSPLMVSLGSLK